MWPEKGQCPETSSVRGTLGTLKNRRGVGAERGKQRNPQDRVTGWIWGGGSDKEGSGVTKVPLSSSQVRVL